MRSSTIVGVLTLLVVLVWIGTACWQAANRQEPAAKQQVERDLFGAPVMSGNQPAGQASDPRPPDDAARASPSPGQNSKSQSGEAEEFGTTAAPPASPGAESLPQQFDPEPAEPFEMPEIMAYA